MPSSVRGKPVDSSGSITPAADGSSAHADPVYSTGFNATLTDGLLRANTVKASGAAKGGGFASANGNLTLTRTPVTNNSATVATTMHYAATKTTTMNRTAAKTAAMKSAAVAATMETTTAVAATMTATTASGSCAHRAKATDSQPNQNSFEQSHSHSSSLWFTFLTCSENNAENTPKKFRC